MNRRKSQSKETKRFKLLIFGTLGAAGAFFVISFLLSLVTYALNDPLGTIGIMSEAALIISAFISGFVISRLGKEGGMLTAFLSGLLFSLIMLLSGFIASGGKIPLSCLLSYAIYIAVTSLAALLARKKGHRRRRKI